tara:strand:+ start:406 stop:714 length:309 start_codon:yes stop_codon:yes gene_type:complete
VGLNRDFVTWMVIASEKLSLKSKEWCFFSLGCVNYRGYFSKDLADKYAKVLRFLGYDVSVFGVSAYSSLGWFHDLILLTFIYSSEIDLSKLIFHELFHKNFF